MIDTIFRDLVRIHYLLDRSFPLNFCGVERVTAQDYTTLHILSDSLRKRGTRGSLDSLSPSINDIERKRFNGITNKFIVRNIIVMPNMGIVRRLYDCNFVQNF